MSDQAMTSFCVFVPVVVASCIDTVTMTATSTCSGTASDCTPGTPTCHLLGQPIEVDTTGDYTFTYLVKLPVTYTCTVGTVTTTHCVTLTGTTQATLPVPAGIPPESAEYCLAYQASCTLTQSAPGRTVYLMGSACVEIKTMAMAQLEVLTLGDGFCPSTPCTPQASCPVPTFTPVMRPKKHHKKCEKCGDDCDGGCDQV
jgi:hypothetical protein